MPGSRVRAPSTAYGFVALQPDGVTPVAYDPCRPVHYVVRAQGEPEGGGQLIADGIARISRATGLQFVDDGATTEVPSWQRQLVQPGVYGDRWAPVLIAWLTADENPDFAADVVGEAASSYVGFDGGPAVARAAVIHELGHMVGRPTSTTPAS